MSKKVCKNQAHTSNDTIHRKIIFKNSSGASMVLFKDLKPEDASQRLCALKRIYSDWRGQLIITR